RLRARPADLGLREYGADATPAGRVRAPAAPFTAGRALRHPAFWLIALVHFGCCAAHSGPIFHMVTHAMDLGVAKMAAAVMLGLSGATSIAGRIGTGLLPAPLPAKTPPAPLLPL